ncbi:MAG: hypothetical protein H0W61_00855 [Bacteroidetes bacterium]|nr:hypothetical protein [Bacteroidota bacterium]
MQSFHNTILSEGQQLLDFESKAQTQDEQVLTVFKAHNKPLTWCMVAECLPDMNQVSLKRSLSTLKNKGLLFKTDVLVKGNYGKQTHFVDSHHNRPPVLIQNRPLILTKVYH